MSAGSFLLRQTSGPVISDGNYDKSSLPLFDACHKIGQETANWSVSPTQVFFGGDWDSICEWRCWQWLTEVKRTCFTVNPKINHCTYKTQHLVKSTENLSNNLVCFVNLVHFLWPKKMAVKTREQKKKDSPLNMTFLLNLPRHVNSSHFVIFPICWHLVYNKKKQNGKQNFNKTIPQLVFIFLPYLSFSSTIGIFIKIVSDLTSSISHRFYCSLRCVRLVMTTRLLQMRPEKNNGCLIKDVEKKKILHLTCWFYIKILRVSLTRENSKHN